MIHLYIKTHNVTGLKYLGKTVQDPHVYKGSGKRWTNHINKHGYDVTTEVVGSYNTLEELIKASIPLSEQLNIVNDPNWANLRVESGDGGDTSKFIDYSKLNRGKGLTYEERYGQELATNMREVRKKPFSNSHKENISKASFGKTYEQIKCHICSNSLPSNCINRHINLCKTKTEKICPTCNITHRKFQEYCSQKCYYQRSNPKL